MRSPSTLRALLLAAVLPLMMATTVVAQNAYPSNLSLPRYIKANTNYSLAMWVRNSGPGYLTSFSVRWRIDGGPWKNGTTINITSPGLGSGNSYMPHTHQAVLNTTPGLHTLEVNVVVPSDPDQSNNTITITFTALSTWAPKVVLLEARTETWCPQCPPSNVVTNTMDNNPNYAVSKWHLSDGFDCPECDTYFNGTYNLNYTPAGIIELGEYGGYTPNAAHSGWADAMSARALGVAPVTVGLSSSVNWATRTMTVDVSANFTHAVTGPFKVRVYVMEDNLPGPQSSAPANYIHQKVMRAMLGGSEGLTTMIPNNPVVGTTYDHTFTYTIPASHNIGDLRLVAFVEHALGANDRYSLNAVKSQASPVGIEENALGLAEMAVWPNPFQNALRLSAPGLSGMADLELFSTDGRTALKSSLALDDDGQGQIILDGDIAPGPYLLRISAPQGQVTQRVMRTD